MLGVVNYPEAKTVVICGDIHGNFKGLVFKLCVQYGLRDTLLVVAGDCGFGFEKPGFYEQVYGQVAGRLRKANNWVVFIRGNHDDPCYFSERRIDHQRWKAVPDYTVIDACGHHILCVGGAVSIDRVFRQRENHRLQARGHRETGYWWSDEAPVFDGEAIDGIPEGILIDTIVTHSSPWFCPLSSKTGLQSWIVNDPGLDKDVTEERTVLGQIYDRLKENGHPVDSWFYGHFHQSWSGVLDDTHFSMLDIEEFKELR